MRKCMLKGYNQVDLLARSDGNNYWVEKRGKSLGEKYDKAALEKRIAEVIALKEEELRAE